MAVLCGAVLSDLSHSDADRQAQLGRRRRVADHQLDVRHHRNRHQQLRASDRAGPRAGGTYFYGNLIWISQQLDGYEDFNSINYFSVNVFRIMIAVLALLLKSQLSFLLTKTPTNRLV